MERPWAEANIVDGVVKPLMFVSRSGGRSDLKSAPLYILEIWFGKHESPEGNKERERSSIKTFLTGTRFRIHFERMPMPKLIKKISIEYDPSEVGVYACGGVAFLGGISSAYSQAGLPFGQLHDKPFYQIWVELDMLCLRMVWKNCNGYVVVERERNGFVEFCVNCWTHHPHSHKWMELLDTKKSLLMNRAAIRNIEN